MISLLLSLARAEELCGGEVLPEGYVCCGNKSCVYFCMVTEYTSTTTVNGNTTTTVHTTYKCLTEHKYNYCYLAYPTILICLAVFLSPTLIVILLQFVIGCRVPLTSLLFSLGMNVSMALFISSLACAEVFGVANITCLLVGILGIILLYVFHRVNVSKCKCCGDPQVQMMAQRHSISQRAEYMQNCCCECCCECCNGYNPDYKQDGCCTCDTLEVLGEIEAPLVSHDDLNQIMQENAEIPPSPIMQGINYFIGYKGRVVITQRTKTCIMYGSWQENGTCEMSGKNKKIIVYSGKQEYEYLPDMDENIAAANRESLQNGAAFAFKYTETSGFTEKAVSSRDNSDICFKSCCVSKVLYNILMIFGWTPIIDGLWRANVQHITFNSKKTISAGTELRAKYNERDREYMEHNKELLI